MRPWAVHGPVSDVAEKSEIPFSMCLCGAQVGSRFGGTNDEALRQSTTWGQSIPSTKRSHVLFVSVARTSCGLVQNVGRTSSTIVNGPVGEMLVARTIRELGVQYARPQSRAHSEAKRWYVPLSSLATDAPQLLPLAPPPSEVLVYAAR